MAGKLGRKQSKKFLYDRKGPWPQPSPREPLGTAPEVLHLPWQEQADWQWHIGLRYFRDMFLFSPRAAAESARFEELPEVTDADMNAVLTQGIYSRFLAPLDPIDRETFAADLEGDDGIFYKFDFSPIEDVEPYPGMYVAKTISLLRREAADSNEFDLKAIAIGADRLVLRPGDGGAWDLSKYYVLQGCSYATLFTEHPNVHFPFDTVNAVTKGSIPTHHLLFRILIPHLRFSLVLDNAVLQGKGSVISDWQATIYDPFTARASDGLMSFFVAGYQGREGNSAYPRWEYPTRLDQLKLPPTPYGEFLRRYFDPFEKFARAVVGHMTAEELSYCQEWSRWIGEWIDGFPEVCFRRGDGATEEDVAEADWEDLLEREKDKLAFLIAVMLWDVTVVHSTDHYDFAHGVPVEYKCFRLRQPPPSAPGGTLDRRTLSTKIDLFKSHLAHRMFFAPTTVTRLMEVDYEFGYDAQGKALRAEENALKERLRAVEAGLRADGIPIFMPLDEMAASIQY
ncbi:MAG: hypothetical protein CMN30_19125 [Sandaracinus sp.]|nr:hypothetical protein [Sandaracinus sp.]